MKIGNTYKELLNESKKYEYGCIMLYLEPSEEFWDSIIGEIDNDDIYKVEGDSSYGVIDRDDVHVTVLYGLHSDVSDKEIEDRVNEMVPPEVTLKDITLFENEGFDVVKFDVYSEDLNRMNKLFSELPHTTDYPDYHPHVTCAYVKSGKGSKYIKELSEENALTIKPTKIIYSKANGEEKEYKFG